MKDYYAVLGVPKGASQAEVKRAYRKSARSTHPDATGGDKKAEARFKEISEAYEVLGDARRRADYDAARSAGPAAGFGGAAAGGPFPPGFDLGNAFAGGQVHVEDLFGSLFGGGGAAPGRGGRRRGRGGSHLQLVLELDLAEACLGTTRTLDVTHPDGSRRSVSVRIPAGVEDGGRVRVRGEGGPGTPPGDLLVEVRVRPHPRLRREGDDLHLDLPLALDEAVLGARVEVPTLEGAVTLAVPPGSSSGRALRLRGKGVARRDGGRGDLYAHVQIVVPTAVDEEAAGLLREFCRRAPTRPPR